MSCSHHLFSPFFSLVKVEIRNYNAHSLVKNEDPEREGRLVRESGRDGIVVLDFETSGMSPDQGDRAIEISAVLIQGAEIIDHFQSLINPGVRINDFIEDYTGITNQMLRGAPKAPDVMTEFSAFISDYPLVAHNAAFDRSFLDAELNRIHKKRRQDFGCSLLVARRLYPDAPNHKLETLIRYKGLPAGTFHRALADAEMTARLWLQMVSDLQSVHGIDEVDFELMQQLAKIKKANLDNYLKKKAKTGKNSHALLF